MSTEKNLNINCGKAVIFTYDPMVFDSVDAINLNCGKAVFSRKAYTQISQKTLRCNAGETVLLDIDSPVADLSDITYLEAGRNLDGMFVYSGDDLIITADSFAALEKVTGLYAPKVFHPESCPMGNIPNLRATLVAYPDGAVLQPNSFDLSVQTVAGIADNALVWVRNRLNATDKQALAGAKARGLRFVCRSLLIYEDDSKAYADLFTFKARTCVPEGYSLVSDDLTLDDAAAAIHGSKIYIVGDLFMHKADEAVMGQMEGLIVDGDATLPLAAVAQFKKIGRAEEIEAYKGTLWNVNGNETVDHQFFQQAIQMGQSYTIKVNGNLIIADDVTPDDLKAIVKLNYNGAVIVSASLAAVLRPQVGQGNGYMGPAKPENGKERPEDDGDSININAGTYKSI